MRTHRIPQAPSDGRQARRGRRRGVGVRQSYGLASRCLNGKACAPHVGPAGVQSCGRKRANAGHHGAHTMAGPLHEWERRDHGVFTRAGGENEARTRLLRASHNARSFLNRPASIPCCLILRCRVL
jgi:hypothetical protein